MIDVSSLDSAQPSFHLSGEQLQMLESSSAAYETRILSLTQELSQLRAQLQERDTEISRLRDAGERANVRPILRLKFEFYSYLQFSIMQRYV